MSIVSRYFFVLLFLSIFLNASILEKKVENLIGLNDYQTHKSLIQLLLKDEKKFLINEKINYRKLFKELQRNGLLNLRLDKPKDISIKFKVLNKNLKAYKILNDTMQSLGYGYFFTEFMQYDEDSFLNWKITFKAEYMIDPVEFTQDLSKAGCIITNVENLGDESWFYEIDFIDAFISNSIKIEKNEKVKFQKPLRPFLLNVVAAKKLQVISRNLNNWFPHIVFFGKDLEVLKVIKKDRIYRGFKTTIPKGTKYVKITDLYNLINIKRGLTVIVR